MGIAKDDLLEVYNVSSAHSMVTNNWGSQCNYLGPPYINDCGYDSAGAILQHAYSATPGVPPLRPAVAANDERILAFDQRPFAPPLGGGGRYPPP